MDTNNEIRRGEMVTDLPNGVDAGVIYIGRIHTPWSSTADCPRHGRSDGPLCRIELFDTWEPALAGVDEGTLLEVFYWLHQSRRDLLLQCPRNDGVTHGTFSLRSPVRPNPIGTSVVRLERREGTNLFVRGLDCLDGTPLIDLKPDRAEFVPKAPPKPADFQIGT